MVSQHPSLRKSTYDSFEIISLDCKVSIYYYKDGTLAIQGDEKNPFHRRIIRQTNKLISKKDYL
ncbi:MAG: hypothetical protein WBV92_06725 [Nitrosotalea sp.]